jgi:hypothetical protein
MTKQRTVPNVFIGAQLAFGMKSGHIFSRRLLLFQAASTSVATTPRRRCTAQALSRRCSRMPARFELKRLGVGVHRSKYRN